MLWFGLGRDFRLFHIPGECYNDLRFSLFQIHLLGLKFKVEESWYIATIDFCSETAFAFISQLKWNKVGFRSLYFRKTNITSAPVHIWHLNVKCRHRCVICLSLNQNKYILSLIIFCSELFCWFWIMKVLLFKNWAAHNFLLHYVFLACEEL